jgi:ABC-2 type transport system ATP-binding protein
LFKGLDGMLKKNVMCPNCKNKITVEGEAGEKVYITCPRCNTRGFSSFPEQEFVQKKSFNAIETKNLTKFYGKIKGIENLNFSVKKGEIFGFLGPNGAGKTTTIRTLLGYLKPTAGEAYILGKSINDDIVDIKRNVGYIPGDLNLYGHLSGRQFLGYFASLRDTEMSLLDDLLKIFDVPLDRKIKGYSKGMKQKLGIIQAFMDDPKIVIMDEPTSGLDPLLQQKFYDFLHDQKKKGRTMFFSSHVLSEVDKICDRVGIIRNGNLVALEDVETLKGKMGRIIRVRIKENPDMFNGPDNMKIKDGWIEFVTNDDVDYWIKILSKYTIVDLEINEFSLEDIFIHYYEGQI